MSASEAASYPRKRYNGDMRRFLLVIAAIGLVVGAGVLTFSIMRSLDDSDVRVTNGAELSTPGIEATRVLGGLDHPWDIDFLPGGTLLFTERSGTLSRLNDGEKVVIATIPEVEATGEGGLMGLAIDPDFDQNSYVYACYNSVSGDVRVSRWGLEEGLSQKNDIITGITAAESGRHSGCQVAFGPDGNLWIGTGDAADESQPQDRSELGGKILRVDRDGQPVADNPDGPDKRVYSYGHRNTQALAFYESPRNGSYGLSVEHGPDRDDEINELSAGNFGWAPGAGYDESAPMTDLAKFPDAVPSVWSSGSSTIAPSGAAFLRGQEWGRLEGWLAVAVLKDQKLVLLNIQNGSVSGERSFFESQYGRLRAATLGSDGSLYVSTDNGTDDAIYRVTAR